MGFPDGARVEHKDGRRGYVLFSFSVTGNLLAKIRWDKPYNGDERVNPVVFRRDLRILSILELIAEAAQ